MKSKPVSLLPTISSHPASDKAATAEGTASSSISITSMESVNPQSGQPQSSFPAGGRWMVILDYNLTKLFPKLKLAVTGKGVLDFEVKIPAKNQGPGPQAIHIAHDIPTDTEAGTAKIVVEILVSGKSKAKQSVSFQVTAS